MSETPDDTWQRVKTKFLSVPKWFASFEHIKWVVGLVIAFAVGRLSIHFVYGGHPHPSEWPIFLSPLVTVAVAIMTFWDHMFDDDLINSPRYKHVLGACVIGIVATFVICIYLTVLRGWERHLLLLLELFGVFIAWDVWMLTALSSEKHKRQRQHIETTNRVVNRPTIVAIVVVLLFLNMNEFDGVSKTANGFSSAHDAFVAGLISFHLVVSAFGYVAFFLNADGSGQPFRKIFGTLLYRLPRGPQA